MSTQNDASSALDVSTGSVAGPESECSECGGQGWYARWSKGGGSPEQIQCEACYGTGRVEERQPPQNKPSGDLPRSGQV